MHMPKQISLLTFIVLTFAASLAQANSVIAKADESVYRIFVKFGSGKYAQGTGFVVSADGLVATNNHVVENAIKIVAVKKQSGKSPAILQGKVVSRSAGLDIALVRFDGLNAKALSIATKLPEKGEKVFAIGYPGVADEAISLEHNEESALESTVTEGIVGRVFDGAWPGRSESMKIVQHSAAISPGNSGGPLLDQCGNVVGINTGLPFGEIRILSPNVAKVVQNQGVFFASSILELIPELRSKGVVVPETSGSSKCVNSATAVSIEAQKTSFGIWHYLIIALGFASIVLVAIAFYFFSKKPKILTESYTHYIKRTKPVQSQSSTLTGKDFLLGSESPSGEKQSFKIKDGSTYNLGRDHSSSQYVIDDPSVSRRHAQVRNINGKLQIRDLGSTNGTFVNGKRAGDTFMDISMSDTILLGKVTLKVR